MKVFLDTNVLLSAIISNGLCADLLKALKNTQPDSFDRTVCFTCQRVLLELKEHLPTKFKWTAPDTEAAITAFSDEYTLAPPAYTTVPCKDEDDGWILADAQLAGCDYFITGDKEVLALYNVGTMRVCTPREMLLWLRTGIPIPKFEAHQERAEYLAKRLENHAFAV
jgi:putative PIN family toxin of toxin-antitoxin system